MFAIADQRVPVRVSVAKVAALRVWTGEALGGDAFGGSSPAFDLAPGAHRQWSWPSTRRGSGAETTGRAIIWGAWLQQTAHCGAYRSCKDKQGRDPCQVIGRVVRIIHYREILLANCQSGIGKDVRY